MLVNHGGTDQKLSQLFYADDAVLLAESVEELDRMVSRSDDVSRRRKLRVKA